MRNFLLVTAVLVFLSCIAATPVINPGELLQQPGGFTSLEAAHDIAIETLIIVDLIVAVGAGGLSYVVYRIFKWFLSR